MKMTEYSNMILGDYIRSIEKVNKILLIGISILLIRLVKKK